MPKNSKTTTSKTTKKTPIEPAATTDGTPAPAIDPSGLTVRQQQLLARLSQAVGISAADLATAADIGRSTAQHDLVALEAAGLARREKGVQEGARRSPDQWFHADATAPMPADAPAAPSPEPDTAVTDPADTADATEVAEPTEDAEPNEDAEAASEPAADAVGAPDEDVEEPAAVPVPADAPDADAADDASGRDEATAVKGPEATTVGDEQGSAGEALAPEPDAEATASTTASPSTQTQPMPTAAAEKTTERLGKGALRALVEDYLRAHPEDDSTPSKIGKDLGRSAGAVSNALDKLLDENIAVQTSVKPRAFRIAVDAISTQVDA